MWMKVEIRSLQEILTFKRLKIDENVAIVSIRCPDEDKLDFSEHSNIIDVLTLKFNDIDRDYPDYPAPKQEDFKGLKEFINLNKSRVDRIIVHCHAGISRSSACASAICKYLNIKDSFIWDSAKYHPNPLVFKLSLNELGVTLTEDELKFLYSRLYEALELDSLPIF